MELASLADAAPRVHQEFLNHLANDSNAGCGKAAQVVLRFSSLSGKVINLNRKTDEGVETCLRRLAASVLKVEAKL